VNEAREKLLKLPTEQLAELLRLTQLYPASTWHFADCGCCLCLHPDGTDASHGFVIGKDGGSDYVKEDE
jgi:hypothetical protein